MLPRPGTRSQQAGKRIISANLSKAAASIERRTRLSAALRAAVPAAGFASFAWIAARFAVAASLLGTRALAPLALALFALVVVAGVVRAMRVPITRAVAVRELDRRAGARGRVIAAHELAGSTDPFAQAAVAGAAGAVVDACARVPALFPLSLPAGRSRAAVLLLLAPASALALRGVSFSSTHRAAGRAETPVAAAPPPARAPLPTLAWVMDEARSRLVPSAPPVPAPTPVALATPAPVPARGSTITDPGKRAYFETVLEGATPITVGQAIVERFTREVVSEPYAKLVAEFQSRNTHAGAKYDPGGDANDAFRKALPREMRGGGGAGGGLGPAIDPSKLKNEYLKSKDDLESETLAAMKESFDLYLKEFAAEMLKGMEAALEKALADPAVGGNRDLASTRLRGLPDAPGGVAEGHDHDGPGEGPMFAAKGPGGTPSEKAGAAGQQALGGTAAGGTGAGAGGDGQAATAGGPAAGRATGERVDLGGRLDERLAVVEVVRRMSGGAKEIDDTAAAEIVRRSTKAAEAEAAVADEIPEEYRGAVRAYFERLTATR